MSFESFLKISRWVSLSKSRPYDFADTLHFPYTSIVFVAFVSLVWIKQYMHKPLECWVPKEFSESWEDYVEYYCWVSGTYYHDMHKDLLSLTPEQRMKEPIGYYQWVPYFMLVQAIMFWVPCVVWKLIAGTTSMPITSLLSVSCGAACDDVEQRDKAAAYIARCILDVLAQKPRRSVSKHTRRNRNAATTAGCYVTVMYFLLKFFLIFHAGLELYFIIVFTNASGAFYGFEWIRDMIEGHEWKESSMFPYVAWCDFEIQGVGNVNRHSVMCVLPNNMLYEKIFLFMWWWLALLAVIEIISIVVWANRLLIRSHRQTFIHRFLHYSGSVGYDRDKRMSRAFINSFLQMDGVFLLHLISDTAGATFSARIVEKMWNVFIDKDYERRAVMQGLRGMKSNDTQEARKALSEV